jgi:hypothetical protein
LRFGTRYSVLGTRHSVLGTRYSVLGTRYSVLGTRYSVLEFNLLFVEHLIQKIELIFSFSHSPNINQRTTKNELREPEPRIILCFLDFLLYFKKSEEKIGNKVRVQWSNKVTV